jgi:hypothetical protein
MILNWKSGLMGHHARLSIIERNEEISESGFSRMVIKIVNLRVLKRGPQELRMHLMIEVRQEDGAPFTWHPGLAPDVDLLGYTSSGGAILYAEAWIDKLQPQYHVYEVAL